MQADTAAEVRSYLNSFGSVATSPSVIQEIEDLECLESPAAANQPILTGNRLWRLAAHPGEPPTG